MSLARGFQLTPPFCFDTVMEGAAFVHFLSNSEIYIVLLNTLFWRVVELLSHVAEGPALRVLLD